MIGIHPINASRQEHGEYHHLFRELKKDAQKFKEYTRMTIDDVLLTLPGILNASHICDQLSLMYGRSRCEASQIAGTAWMEQIKASTSILNDVSGATTRACSRLYI